MEQQDHWETTLANNPDMYGLEPSDAAVAAAARFREIGASSVLELGAGQGRDTLYFVGRGFDVTATDFTGVGLDSIRARVEESASLVRCVKHDVRLPLPFHDDSFDACYSHMLFSMALSTDELVSLLGEIRRVVRPGGLVAYTARTTHDAHYLNGIDRGDEMFEHGGFVVHFFGPELIQQLTEGFEIIDRFEFTEGELPRRIISVTMQECKVG